MSRDGPVSVLASDTVESYGARPDLPARNAPNPAAPRGPQAELAPLTARIPPFIPISAPRSRAVGHRQPCCVSLAPYRLAPYRLAPYRLAPYRLAPYRLAPYRLALYRLAPHRLKFIQNDYRI